jgi:hypothetical protein
MRIVALLLLVGTGGAVWWHHRRTRPQHRVRRVLGALVIGMILLPVPLIYGRWAYMVVRCGHEPVAISDFAAAHSYRLPSDRTYRRDSLFQDYVCSEAEARRLGYERGSAG